MNILKKTLWVLFSLAMFLAVSCGGIDSEDSSKADKGKLYLGEVGAARTAYPDIYDNTEWDGFDFTLTGTMAGDENPTVNISNKSYADLQTAVNSTYVKLGNWSFTLTAENPAGATFSGTAAINVESGANALTFNLAATSAGEGNGTLVIAFEVPSQVTAVKVGEEDATVAIGEEKNTVYFTAELSAGQHEVSVEFCGADGVYLGTVEEVAYIMAGLTTTWKDEFESLTDVYEITWDFDGGIATGSYKKYLKATDDFAEIVKPTVTKDGYIFNDWQTDVANHSIKALWKPTKYTELATATNNLVKENFAETESLSAFAAYETKGITLKGGLGHSITDDKKLEIKDSSKNVTVVIDPGLVKDEVEGYFEFSAAELSGNYDWDIVNFLYGGVSQLRIWCSTTNTPLVCSVKGGTPYDKDYAGNTTTTVNMFTNTTYKIYYKLSEEKLTLTINDVVVYDDEDVGISMIDVVEIRNSNSGKRAVTIDNIAICGTPMETGADYKDLALAALKDEYAKYVDVSTDTAKDNYKIKYNDIKTAYNAAVTAVTNKAEEENSTIADVKATLATQIATIAKDNDEKVIGDYITEQVAAELTSYKASEIEEIDDETEKSNVVTAKDAAIASITTAKVMEDENYSTTYETIVATMIASAKAEIDKLLQTKEAAIELDTPLYEAYKTEQLATVKDSDFATELKESVAAPQFDTSACTSAVEVHAALEATKDAYDEWLAAQLAAKTYTISFDGSDVEQTVKYGGIPNLVAVDPCDANNMVKDGKFYTDDACTTEYEPAEVYSNFTLYYQTVSAVEVTSKDAFSWAAITGVANKTSLAQTDLTGVNAFIHPGTELLYRNDQDSTVSGVTGGVLNTNKNNSAFSVDFAGTGTLKIGVRGGGNTANVAFYLANAEGNKVVASYTESSSGDTVNSESDNVYTMYSKTYQLYTFTISAAGTYMLYVTDGVLRFGSIEKVDNYKGAANKVASVSLDKTSLELNKVDPATTITATITAEDPSVPTNYIKSVEWTSSDESVATVDENGSVTPVSAGTTTITYTLTQKDDTIKTATCAVTVVETAVTLTAESSVEITGEKTVQAEKTIVLTAQMDKGYTEDLSYQWFKDGTEIDGATSETYSFKPSAAGSASFTVKVTSDSYSTGVTSVAFEVTITAKPTTVTKTFEFSNDTVKTAAGIGDGASIPNGTVVDGVFTLTYTGTAPKTHADGYVTSKSNSTMAITFTTQSENATLSITYSGSNTSRTYTIKKGDTVVHNGTAVTGPTSVTLATAGTYVIGEYTANEHKIVSIKLTDTVPASN